MEHCYTIELKYYPEQIKWIISQILGKTLNCTENISTIWWVEEPRHFLMVQQNLN